MNLHRTLVVMALLSSACSATRPEIAAPPAKSAPAVVVAPGGASPAVAAAPEACPPLDLAALEPRPETPDPRRLDLAEVFPRDEIRAPGVAPEIVTLDRTPYSRSPIGGDPGGSIGVGLGFPGLDPAWVIGDLAPPVAAALSVWAAASRGRGEQQHNAYLLHKRENVLRALPAGNDGVALRCATAARARAEALAAAHEAIARDASTRTVALIDAHPTPSAAETLVLGALLGEYRSGQRDEASPSLARARQLLSGLTRDATAPRELRARAAEQLAGLERSTSSDALTTALRQVIALTADPELRVETLIKLADLEPGTPAALEKQLDQILVELARAPANYRVAMTLAKLAQVRLGRGELALARDAAVACARATGTDSFDSVDPWGCAPLLADALDELGGAAPGSEIPLSFVAPLGLEIMSRATGRLDRDEARRAGELLLARLPMSSEAPHAVDLLASIAADPQAARALHQQRERDYSPGSAWLAAQRWRLARGNDIAATEKALGFLLAPASPLGTPPPTTPELRREELEQRVAQTVQRCENELAASGREIALRIDTTASIPKATARGASPKLAACLERAVVTGFRSVGPAKISVILTGS